MQVVLAERHETPVVQLSVEFPGGYTADLGNKLGTASFTMGMLDEGAGEYSALQLAARKEALGAEIGTGAGLDSATTSLSALSDKLPESLDLLADILRRPTFAAGGSGTRARDLDRRHQAGEGASADRRRCAIMPPLLYGPGHPYAIPFTGSGTEAPSPR